MNTLDADFLRKVHLATEAIERLGVNGLPVAIHHVGQQLAFVLLVAVLRGYVAPKGAACRPNENEIESIVNAIIPSQ